MANLTRSLLLISALTLFACSDEPPTPRVSDAESERSEESVSSDDALDTTSGAERQLGPDAAMGEDDAEASEGDGSADSTAVDRTHSDITDPSSVDSDAPAWPEPLYGLSTQSVVHDGLTREYALYVPASYTGEAATPVLINFHGGAMSAQGQLYLSDMRDLSESEGFLLVYPEGSELESGDQHWNPIPPSADSKSDTDDFGFVAAMLDHMAEGHNVDAEGVYVTGYSNGAGMAYGLVCYLSERIAAAAPVSGSMYGEMAEGCNATHPTAVAVFNGTQDTERPYDGLLPWFLAVEDAVAFWVSHNGITDAPSVETFETAGVTVERRVYAATEGGAAVMLHKVIGGGHDWFGFDIEGAGLNQTIWDFVSAHSLGGAL